MRGSLLLFAALGACSGGGGDVTIDITHDVCAPITVNSASLTEVQAKGIDDAMALWSDHGVTTLERSGAEPAVEVRFDHAAAAFYGLYDDVHSIVYINDDITDPKTLEIVIAHELGHAFGLSHITGRPSLMNAHNDHTLPTTEDEAAVRALWGPCPAP